MTSSSSNGPPSEFRPAEPSPTPTPGSDVAVTPISPAYSHPAPGWYVEPGKPGVLRYWNGAGWEEWRKPLVEAPMVTQGQKSVPVAYRLAVFLGGLGIHNFYLGRVGAGVGMLVLWLLGLMTSAFIVGFFLLLAVSVWLIVDLCLIPSYVRTSALRAVRTGA